MPAPKSEDKIQMTAEQLDAVVQAAVDKAMRARQEAAEDEAPARSRKLTNADLSVEAGGSNKQTQEDVTMTALTIGPVSHPPGKFADPPEAVAARDYAEHQALIGRLQTLGYTIVLKGVEFSARYEPSEEQVVDGKKYRKMLDVKENPEPAEAADLLAQLSEADPRNSRIWIRNWMQGRIISNEQQLDVETSSDAQRAKVSALQSVQAGDLSGLDNADIDIGAPPDGVEMTRL